MITLAVISFRKLTGETAKVKTFWHWFFFPFFSPLNMKEFSHLNLKTRFKGLDEFYVENHHRVTRRTRSGEKNKQTHWLTFVAWWNWIISRSCMMLQNFQTSSPERCFNSFDCRSFVLAPSCVWKFLQGKVFYLCLPYISGLDSHETFNDSVVDEKFQNLRKSFP